MTRIHTLLGAMLAGALFFAAPGAFAQEKFGHAGGFAIGAERITGFAVTHTEAEFEAGPLSFDYESDTTSFSFLATDPESPFVSPRVGFDFFVIDGLSLGGFIGYASNDTEGDFDGDDEDEEQQSSTFMFGPRVGYAYMFSDIFGIWPRGGITYVSGNVEDDNEVESETSLFALSAELMLVLSPVEHAAFIFGPTMDFTISGDGEFNNPAGPDGDIDDLKVNTFGVQAGIVAWF